MMRSPLAKALSVASWLITGLSAVNEGLRPLGYDFYKLQFMLNNPKLAVYLQYLVGIAGVVSLVMFALSCYCMGSDCCDGAVCPKCGVTPCTCHHMTRHHNKI